MTRPLTARVLALALLGALGGCSDPAASDAAGGTHPAPADPSALAVAPFRSYDAATFYQTVTYLAPPGRAFSADGRRLLATSDASGVFNAQAIERSSATIVPLTGSTDYAVFAQSWFPDDDRLLYTYDEGGNELNHLMVRELDGSTHDLTPGEGLKASFVGWRDDGRAFFIASNERDASRFDLYRYATDGYRREMVYENTPGWDLGALSRDGAKLALLRNVSGSDDDLYLVDLTGPRAEPRLLTAHDGNVEHTPFTFTPDGAGLVYGSNAHGEFQQAWRCDLASGDQTPLVTADWDVVGVTYSSTGRYRVSYVNRDAVTVMSVADAASGAEIPMPVLPAGEVLNVRFSADDAAMAFLVNGDARPSDVFGVELGGPPAGWTARAYTDALNPAIERAHLVEGSVVRYPSFDGLEIPAILYRPVQASAEHPVPALVLVHGGPGGQTTRGYSAMIQHLVNHGYAVLGANNRGSSGYGKTFFHLDDRRHGEDDLRDIVAGRGYLESLDWVDGERVGIIGGSYGGYMAAAALTFHPQAFDAGIDVFGVTNWVRTLSSIPAWWGPFRDALYDEMGDPATDQERHRRISPLFHAEQIERPLLVVQGANDPRVLKVESDELVEAARGNDVPVEYLVFEDEGHGFRKRSNRIDASEAYVHFLDRYLKGLPESAPGSS